MNVEYLTSSAKHIQDEQFCIPAMETMHGACSAFLKMYHSFRSFRKSKEHWFRGLLSTMLRAPCFTSGHLGVISLSEVILVLAPRGTSLNTIITLWITLWITPGKASLANVFFSFPSSTWKHWKRQEIIKSSWWTMLASGQIAYKILALVNSVQLANLSNANCDLNPRHAYYAVCMYLSTMIHLPRWFP